MQCGSTYVSNQGYFSRNVSGNIFLNSSQCAVCSGHCLTCDTLELIFHQT